MTNQDLNIILYDRDLSVTEEKQLYRMLASCKEAAMNGSLCMEWDHWQNPISLKVRRSLQARGLECWVANNIFRATWGLPLTSDTMVQSQRQFDEAEKNIGNSFRTFRHFIVKC